MSAVKSAPIRIIAGLLLVIAILSLSGLPSMAATWIDAQHVSSCCDSDCDGESPKESAPCSAPDCPCFSCVSMLISAQFTLLHFSTVEVIASLPTRSFHLSEYIASIDHPPRFS